MPAKRKSWAGEALFCKTNNKIPGMLTHFGNFLCSIAGKGSFKTDLSLWRTALAGGIFT